MKFKAITIARQEDGLSVSVYGASTLTDAAKISAVLAQVLELQSTEAAPMPFTTAHTITMQVTDIAPERVVAQEAAKSEPPKATAAPTTPAPSALQASSTPPAPAAPSDAPKEDLAIFGRFTKLSETVKEIRRRGVEDFTAIVDYCKRLGDLGDVCPPIDALVSQGQLEARLKVHCAGVGVAGVPA